MVEARSVSCFKFSHFLLRGNCYFPPRKVIRSSVFKNYVFVDVAGEKLPAARVLVRSPDGVGRKVGVVEEEHVRQPKAHGDAKEVPAVWEVRCLFHIGQRWLRVR